MIRAAELAVPAKPVPYYRRRIAELVAAGLAKVPTNERRDAAQVRRERTATRLSWDFSKRLATMQDVVVYYSRAGYKLAFRRVNPRPALNGKLYVPPLPADAKIVGRYSFPFSRRAFLRDLLEVIGCDK